MVVAFVEAWLRLGMVLAQNAPEPVLERLDPPRRAAVVMALLALVLTGLLLVACVMVGGHWVRRMARQRPGKVMPSTVSSIQNRRLRESIHKILPSAKTEDTLHADTSSKDTKVDP